jgi:mRNA deadenylase 3'-5' endonuclease subunit Ccr4
VRPWLSVPENLLTFKVLSYNVLADCLANLKKDDDPYMQFNVRFTKIKAEIVDSDADVVAL